MITNKYTAAFLIPEDAKRILSDDGWKFQSKNKISRQIEELLSNHLTLKETDNRYSSYEGGFLKIDVFKDVKGKVDYLYFRFYDSKQPTLPLFLKDEDILKNLLFFVPTAYPEFW